MRTLSHERIFIRPYLQLASAEHDPPEADTVHKLVATVLGRRLQQPRHKKLT